MTSEQAARLVAEPELLWELDEGEPPAVIDLDKAWHGNHWLLSGSAGGGGGPLAEAVFGGDEFGEDEGYGPPRLLAPERVSTVNAALSTVTDDDLRNRLDPVKMIEADLYPTGIWDEADLFDEYLARYVGDLRALYAYAAAIDLAVVQSLA